MAASHGTRGPYKKLAAVLDGARCTEVAVEVAAGLAERAGSTLHVVGAVLAGGAPVDLGEAVPITQPGSREYSEHLEEHVEVIAGWIRARRACTVQTAMLDAGGRNGLIDYAIHAKIDLLVVGLSLGTHAAQNRSGHLRARSMRRAPGPLLLFPSTPEEAGPGLAGRIPRGGVAAVYESHLGAPSSLLAHAATFARLAGADLWVIALAPDGERLVPLESAIGSGPFDLVSDRLAATRHADGLRVRTHVITAPDPHETLLEFVREREISTLAVGAQDEHLTERVLRERSRRSVAANGTIRRIAVLWCPIPAMSGHRPA